MRLTILFGAGTLKLSPGAENLVDGMAVYNVPQLKPEIIREDGRVEIRQGDFKNIVNFQDVKNKWDLKLGKTPIDLNLNAGAYNGDYELGGLSLTSLTVRDGAANVDLTFSDLNQTEMSVLRYETGASDVKLAGLAHANFSTLIFSGGAGNYTLDFTGTLKEPRQDPRLREMGFGSLEGRLWDTLDPGVQEGLARFEGFAAPGGESFEDLRARVLSFLDGLRPGRHLVFTHGGVVRALSREVGEDHFVPTGTLLVLDWDARRLLSRRDGEGEASRGLPAAGGAEEER